jgi:uncharacterized SAM-binding protein YcdF (DUF218 family)
MIALSAIFNTLFLSPVLFALLIGVGIALVATNKRRAALWLFSATLGSFLALSTAPVRNVLLRPLESRYPPFPANAPRVDAVVVLGGGLLEGAPDEGGNPSLGGDSYKRVVYAYALSRSLGLPVIVSGGRAWNAGGTRTEAQTAAVMLARLGMPRQLIISEEASRNTLENAREVSRIVEQRKLGRVALVTSAYHMRRAMIAFSRFGVSCVPAPTDYQSESGRTTFAGALPSFASLEASFKALREYVGIAAYRVRR